MSSGSGGDGTGSGSGAGAGSGCGGDLGSGVEAATETVTDYLARKDTKHKHAGENLIYMDGMTWPLY
jgi:hypothetical protein